MGWCPSPIIMPSDRKSLRQTTRDKWRLTNVRNGVRFDIDGDGVEEQVSWTAPNSGIGFLALDRNGNGRIDNGKELYGSWAVPGKTEGFAALIHDAALANGGQKSPLLEEGHPLYDMLVIWTDDNHNGLSEPDEIVPLKTLYSSIALSYTDGDNHLDRHGNMFFLEGSASIRTAQGRNRSRSGQENADRVVRIYDVFFRGARQ